MRNFWLILIASVGIAWTYPDRPTVNQGTSHQYYNQLGQYQGRDQRTGDMTQFYGADGRYQGYELHHNGLTTSYGPVGQYQGYVRSPDNARHQ